MNTTYNPQEPSAVLINEIKYYMAFSALKKLFLKGLITKENCEKANVATIFSGYRDSFILFLVVVLSLPKVTDVTVT